MRFTDIYVIEWDGERWDYRLTSGEAKCAADDLTDYEGKVHKGYHWVWVQWVAEHLVESMNSRCAGKDD